MLQPSDTLGSYTVLAHLRTGGMASLYLARRRGAAGFRKLVAIKVVRAGLSESSAMIRMFVHEARIAAHLAHPNVVHVEELGESAGLFYLVMEYVHGCSLSQLLRALSQRERRLSVRAAVAIALRIAEGLAAVHDARDESGRELSIVHRDVSPQNVLLSAQGHVKLIDFGVAKARVGEGADDEGGIQGKLGYMAPEQARGEVVDARADQYALGVMLWEMLAGRRLIAAGSDLDMLRQASEPSFEPPRAHAPAVPEGVEAVVMRALARERDARFPSVRELRRALAAAMPEALAVDSEALAELVRSAVGTELERVLEELPDEATRALGVERGAPASAEEVLATLTSPASRSDVSTGTEPSAVRRRVGVRVALAAFAVAVGVALGAWAAGGGGAPEPAALARDEAAPREELAPLVIEASPRTENSDAGLPGASAPAAADEAPTRARRTRRGQRRAEGTAEAAPRAPSVVHGTPILTDLP